MIAVERCHVVDGDVVYTGYVQVDTYDGIPVLEPARWKGGLSRDTVRDAIRDARGFFKARRKKGSPRFRRMQETIAVQRSRPPGRTVYSGMVKVDEHDQVPVFERAAGSSFHWPEDIDEAVSAARKKESS